MKTQFNYPSADRPSLWCNTTKLCVKNGKCKYETLKLGHHGHSVRRVLVHPMIQLLQAQVHWSLSAPLWLGFLEMKPNGIYKIFSDMLNNGPTGLKGRRVSFGHVSPARPRLCLQPRASLITLSSDSPIPCVTQQLPQHCRLSSLAPSPHSTSAPCHWAKREGEKIYSTPAQCQQMSRTQTCRGEVSEHRGR